jgi:hypothetical protein
MKEREKTIPPQCNPRIPEAIERLVQLYASGLIPAFLEDRRHPARGSPLSIPLRDNPGSS